MYTYNYYTKYIKDRGKQQKKIMTQGCQILFSLGAKYDFKKSQPLLCLNKIFQQKKAKFVRFGPERAKLATPASGDMFSSCLFIAQSSVATRRDLSLR